MILWLRLLLFTLAVVGLVALGTWWGWLALGPI